MAQPEPVRTTLNARLAHLRQNEAAMGHETVEKELVALIRQYPDSAEGYAALARNLLKQKKIDYAVRAAEKAAALAPLNPKAYVMLGVARLRSEDLPGASEAFSRALEFDKNSVKALLGAAAVKMQDEHYDDALDLCGRVMKLDPDQQRVHELIARIKMKQGKTEDAGSALRKVLEQDQSNPRAMRAYIRLMREEGRMEEVVALAEAQLAAEPFTAKAVSRYARMVSAAGRPELAVAQYRKFMKDHALREVDKIGFVSALIEAGELVEARAAIASFKDRAAMKPLKMKLTADADLAEGHAERAIDLYKAACELASVQGLEQAADGQPAAAELALDWQAHAAKVLREALREHRSERSAREN